jgi:succinate dehydrogenase / fumarate reductase flavoprotein subunit
MNQDLVQHWELENLLQVSMVIAQSALWRRESRGCHFRMDYPERKDQFNHHTLAFMSELDEVRFEKRPVDMSIYEAKGEHYERFGIIERKY